MHFSLSVGWLCLAVGIHAAAVAPAISLSPAQSSLICREASAALSVFTSGPYSSSALSFCSSYIHIPAVTTTVTSTSTIQATTSSTSVTTIPVTFTTTATSTYTSYSIAGAIAARDILPLSAASTEAARLGVRANQFPNPTMPPTVAAVRKRNALPAAAMAAPKASMPAKPFASAITSIAGALLSAGCSCIASRIPLSTTSIYTTISTTTTITVPVSSTTTLTVATTTTTVGVPTVSQVCLASNNYGFVYTGGYVDPSPGQTGLAIGSLTNSAITSQQGCCALCYQTTGCYLYYLDSGNNSICTLYVINAGSAPDASPQCPNGDVLEYADLSTSGYFGFGACAIYEGAPS